MLQIQFGISAVEANLGPGMKDLLLFAFVVIETLNYKISRCWHSFCRTRRNNECNACCIRNTIIACLALSLLLLSSLIKLLNKRTNQSVTRQSPGARTSADET